MAYLVTLADGRVLTVSGAQEWEARCRVLAEHRGVRIARAEYLPKSPFASAAIPPVPPWAERPR